jgi:hypothetical protein
VGPPGQTANAVEIVDEDHDDHGEAAEDIDGGQTRWCGQSCCADRGRGCSCGHFVPPCALEFLVQFGADDVQCFAVTCNGEPGQH